MSVIENSYESYGHEKKTNDRSLAGHFDKEAFRRDGHFTFSFAPTSTMKNLQDLFRSEFSEPVETWTGEEASFDEHIDFVNHLVEVVSESGLVTQLMKDNVSVFEALLGPDIDVQLRPHVRVTRPSAEEDLIAWHRDTFYGSSPYELNLWFPVFALPDEAGLRVLTATHVIQPQNVRATVSEFSNHQRITKGSAANQAGFLYEPKTEDRISDMKSSDVTICRPDVGAGTLFFASLLHAGKASPKQTRISIDVRVRSPFAPTQTKPGYYGPLQTGVVESCARKFLGQSSAMAAVTTS